MQNFVIAYDIFNVKRLNKVKKVVYSYALGGQKSALEAPLDKPLMKTLVKELKNIIEAEDKVNIIKVSEPILLGKATQISHKKNGIIII